MPVTRLPFTRGPRLAGPGCETKRRSIYGVRKRQRKGKQVPFYEDRKKGSKFTLTKRRLILRGCAVQPSPNVAHETNSALLP
jgi:hypothetical protein